MPIIDGLRKRFNWAGGFCLIAIAIADTIVRVKPFGSINRVVVTSVGVFIVVVLIATGFILYGRGYRISQNDGLTQIAGTGLLVLTSNPDGARVYVDGNLTTATNNTINLKPGQYQIRIEKDGYHAWQKTIQIRKEEVAQATVSLFPAAPALEAITTLGALDPITDPSGTLIAYRVASQSAEKNGIYVIDMTARSILPFGGTTTQIADDLLDQFSDADISFSPDGKDILATITSGLAPRTYLLSVKNGKNPQNISTILSQIQTQFEEQQKILNIQILENIPKKLRTFSEEYMSDIRLSPDNDRLLYTASASATVPFIIHPPLPGSNSTPEIRDISQGNTYVYDIKEDRNYLIFDASPLSPDEDSPSFYWHANSRNLLFINPNGGRKTIDIIEFDGTNRKTIYAGPLSGNYLFPWVDGSSVAILTNLNVPDTPPNIYQVGLK